jgi:hypothetical protein
LNFLNSSFCVISPTLAIATQYRTHAYAEATLQACTRRFVLAPEDGYKCEPAEALATPDNSKEKLMLTMDITAAPAEYALPLKKQRQLNPPFRVQVRLSRYLASLASSL